MLSTIGSSTGAYPAPSTDPTTGASRTSIEAKITRYKKELSACVNCSSAKTPEGKAAIQELSNKIKAAEARIEKIAADKPTDQSQTPVIETANNSPTRGDNATSTAERRSAAETASAAMPADITTGSLVDVYA